MRKELMFILIVPVLIGVFYLVNKKSTHLFRKQIDSNDVNTISQQSSEEKYISPLSINYLRSLNIDSEKPNIEEELSPGSNYKRYIASYMSEGNKIYGLLTIPTTPMPVGGYPAIVFNHGYIPPKQYNTTQGYVAYVDTLAKNGFVIFKIDFRGNGNSEGDASGSYFSSAYTIDSVSALKSLQKMQDVNPNRIGMWGHSMSGNVTMRALLVSKDIKAAVIWAGAVYSYSDFAKYRINDTSYTHRPFETKEGDAQRDREVSPEIQKIRNNSKDINFENDFWTSISLTKNIDYLNAPLQLHHAVNDSVVNIGYSRDLVDALKNKNKKYEYFEYSTGGHNITSPSFDMAMTRTVEFFKNNL